MCNLPSEVKMKLGGREALKSSPVIDKAQFVYVYNSPPEVGRWHTGRDHFQLQSCIQNTNSVLNSPPNKYVKGEKDYTQNTHNYFEHNSPPQVERGLGVWRMSRRAPVTQCLHVQICALNSPAEVTSRGLGRGWKQNTLSIGMQLTCTLSSQLRGVGS